MLFGCIWVRLKTGIPGKAEPNWATWSPKMRWTFPTKTRWTIQLYNMSDEHGTARCHQTVASKMMQESNIWIYCNLVGGLEHFLLFHFFHILGIVTPTDSYFSEGLKPLTRWTFPTKTRWTIQLYNVSVSHRSFLKLPLGDGNFKPGVLNGTCGKTDILVQVGHLRFRFNYCTSPKRT